MNNNNYNNNPMMNNLVNLMSMGQTPQQIVQNVIANNPQLQQTFSQMSAQNISPRDMVYRIAQQKGIDITPMIEYLRRMGNNI